MKEEELKKVIELHEKWLNGESDGQKANLSGADLSGTDLSGANLRYANLSGADLSGTDLRYANLSGADLRYANLSGTDLSGANLSGTDLSDANLSGTDLSGADLRYANLSGADLSGTDLSGADLRYANLSGTDLRYANLSGTDLSDADLSDANLSGAKGLLSAIDYLESHFEKTEEGYIAYKTFNGSYNPPEKWVIQPNSIITENVNFGRTKDCGYGINVAPLNWVRKQYSGTIWKVLIRWEWLVGVCVPYHTDGKIRCERVQLLEVVENG